MTATHHSQLAELSDRTRRLSAPRVSELVLQTAQYDAMRDWYRAVLGGEWSVDNRGRTGDDRVRYDGSPKQVRASDVRSCFMFLDRSLTHGQVFALFELPELGSRPTRDPGLNHTQFRHADLPSLLERVELLLAHGIEPHRAANHGPLTSFYFCDPDQNVVEFCSNNFDTPEGMFGFINSDAFKQNPSGVEIDAREFLASFHAGTPLDRLLSLV